MLISHHYYSQPLTTQYLPLTGIQSTYVDGRGTDLGNHILIHLRLRLSIYPQCLRYVFTQLPTGEKD